jgi:hypothetical protein
MDNMTPLEHHQASFVLKALRDGWTVHINNEDEFVFVRGKDTLAKTELVEINKSGYSNQFISKYLLS